MSPQGAGYEVGVAVLEVEGFETGCVGAFCGNAACGLTRIGMLEKKLRAMPGAAARPYASSIGRNWDPAA
jgi:hypothetical protein